MAHKAAMRKKQKASFGLLAAGAVTLWWLRPGESESGLTISVAVPGAVSRVQGMALSPNGRSVAAVVRDYRRPASGQARGFASESTRISVWGTDGGALLNESLARFEPRRGNWDDVLGRGNAIADGIAYSPDGQWLAYTQRGLRAQRLRDGLVRSWPAAGGGQAWPRFSPDGRFIATGAGSCLSICDFEQPERILKTVDGGRTPISEDAHAMDAAFSPDGTILAVAVYDELRLWDWKRGRLRRAPRAQNNPASDLCYSPDGRLLAIGTGSTAEIYDARTLSLTHTIEPANRVFGVAFSPDGRLLATSGPTFRNGPRLWTRKLMAGRQTGHDAPIHDTIGTVSLWHASSGSLAGQLHGGRWAIQVAFSRDGRWVAATSDDDTMRLWPAPQLSG